jgi:hypothetical protein
MPRAGLITLADVPKLKPGAPAISRIAIARLDDKLQDPRYGKFAITQQDVDGWTQNLAETFGGRVAIDFDHSSDRGRGTRAAGWITSIGQVGKLVTADVEWTPRGARAIRRGDYRYISPTFVGRYVDEHGQNRGRALLGAGLTNRPVLRAGMPTLSLSRDRFDGVATPPKRKKTMTEKDKKQLSWKQTRERLDNPEKLRGKTLSRKAERKLLKRIQKMVDQSLPVLLDSADPDAVITLAAYAPDGIVPAGTVNWDQPATGLSRVPPGLDAAGKALHSMIATRAASAGVPYLEAMSRVTGNPDYSQLSDVPPEPVLAAEQDPDRRTLYLAARALAAREGIGWMDAAAHLDHQRSLAALQADDGSNSTPWLDTRQLAAPPRPWSKEDWYRDERRARAAGVPVDEDLWRAAAERGQDIVGALAEQNRAAAIDAHQARNEGFLDQARQREDDKRAKAIGDELFSRAHKRVAPRASDVRNRSSFDFPSGRSAGTNDPDLVRADLLRLQQRSDNGDLV